LFKEPNPSESYTIFPPAAVDSRPTPPSSFPLFERSVAALEHRLTLPVVALIAGSLLLALSALGTSPQFTLMHHGKWYAVLSNNPFDWSDNYNLRFRILGPLLGFLLFLRGPLFPWFMLGLLAVFFALVYGYCRKAGWRAADVMGLLLLLAFSTLTFYTWSFPGYTDSLTYVLLTLAWFSPPRMWIRTFLLSALLFNHEQTVFLFPLFFLLWKPSGWNAKSWLVHATLFVAAAIPYFLYRQFIHSISPVEYTVGYYFDPGNLAWTHEHVKDKWVFGLFQSFRLSWVFVLAGLLLALRDREWRNALFILLPVALAASQYYFAYDLSRLGGLAFPSFFVAGDQIRKQAPGWFVPLVAVLVLANLFVPAYCVGALDPLWYGPFWLR
jgi:hypothetical protein